VLGQLEVVRQLARCAGLLLGLVEGGQDHLALGLLRGMFPLLQALLKVDHLLEDGADDAGEGVGHRVSEGACNASMKKSVRCTHLTRSSNNEQRER
jgi:hypothetical protein